MMARPMMNATTGLAVRASTGISSGRISAAVEFPMQNTGAEEKDGEQLGAIAVGSMASLCHTLDQIRYSRQDQTLSSSSPSHRHFRIVDCLAVGVNAGLCSSWIDISPFLCFYAANGRDLRGRLAFGFAATFQC